MPVLPRRIRRRRAIARQRISPTIPATRRSCGATRSLCFLDGALRGGPEAARDAYSRRGRIARRADRESRAQRRSCYWRPMAMARSALAVARAFCAARRIGPDPRSSCGRARGRSRARRRRANTSPPISTASPTPSTIRWRCSATEAGKAGYAPRRGRREDLARARSRLRLRRRRAAAASALRAALRRRPFRENDRPRRTRARAL